MIFLLLLILLAVAGAIFYFGGFAEELGLLGRAPKPYIAQGNIKAFTLEAVPTGDAAPSESTLRAHYREAVAYAKEHGYNTLIYSAKQGLQVYWRDNIFPPADGLAKHDAFMYKFDPLAILCEEAEGQEIQVWVAADPYATTGYIPGLEGKVPKLLDERATPGSAAFAVDDAEYQKLLVQSLSALPRRYPVAGVLLTGLSASPVGSGSPEDWYLPFRTTVESVWNNWRQKDYEATVSLSLQHATSVQLKAASDLTQVGAVQFLVTQLPGPDAIATALDAFGPDARLVVQPAANDTGLGLFTAAEKNSYHGVLYGGYPALQQQTARIGLLESALIQDETTGTLPEGFDIPQTLSVNYPQQNAKISTEGLFIMGTSNPAEPLLLDGNKVAVRGPKGAFGVAVTLQYGSNSFTFSQGGNSFTLTVERPEPVETQDPPQPPPADGTREAPAGQAVRIATQIASALTDYTDDRSINETLPYGATFIVTESVETTRYNSARGRTEATWAYRMAGGDWVLARNCEWLSGTGVAGFTGITVQPDEKGEWLTFEGSGTPAAYVAYGNENGILKLTFYNTEIALGAAVTGRYISSATVEAGEDGSTILSLATKGIWGYSLEYIDGQTKLFLKKPPQRSANPARPLEGTHVLLDPGHGDTDVGAPGLMGNNGPNEKDINLRLAQAIAFRLRQLGATVSMTREGDTFPSLEDRLAAQTELKPDFFLSVHHNSAELTRDLNDAAGSQVYYFHPYNTPLSKIYAQNLLNSIAAATGRRGGDAQWGYYYVTRTTVCPSVLFEYGFVINPQEFEDITSTRGIRAAAFATADGILASLPASQGDAPAGSDTGAASIPPEDATKPEEDPAQSAASAS